MTLTSGFDIDLRVVGEASFGAALMYFTGARAHTIALRRRAMARGWKLNEYGLFAGERCLAAAREEEIYARLGLPWISPLLRENRGEIAAAEAGTLPQLLRLSDIRGDLHCHTRAGEGTASVAEMAAAARALGRDYLAITDRVRGPGVARGLDPEALAAQLDEIDALNARLRGIRILKSCEVEIDEDGRLALRRDLLERLDFTVCAIHTGLSAPREALTARLLRAMDDPAFTILAHPSVLLIGKGAPPALDLERVMRAALERGCTLEVNARPERLDLDDVHCKMAREMGLKLVVCSDARSPAELALMRFGVDQAARGWLEARDVLNTRPVPALLASLQREG
ncbi:MAG: DNA polymerase/3'-5' exonuclease PolX [Alphaproteobacteria bacterium]|nr:MAG: DNA polymerase/3'-5' exonuclease PolX [Alphaproteobacteria bacterium]